MGSAKVFYAKRGASMNKRGCLIKKAPYSKHFQCFFNKYLYLQNKTTNRKIQFIGVGTGGDSLSTVQEVKNFVFSPATNNSHKENKNPLFPDRRGRRSLQVFGSFKKIA